MPSPFKDVLASGKFIVTSEVAPPKGTNLKKFKHHIELLKDKVDAMNVTDHQSSVMRFPSLGGCLLVKELGGEVILQMTCRDRNRLALQGDLLFASSRRIMEKGKDLGGNELDGGVSFCAGAIVTPEADPLEPQLIKFEKKIDAGAEFIQTQAVFNLDKFKAFMDYARQFNVKILAGIILLTSAPMARFMNKNIAGVSVPQDLIDEMASVPKGQTLNKGIEIAGRMIKRLHDEKICDGVHIMAIGKEDIVPDIMNAAGLN
ncbi:MAG: methylenetetrahydrofolate reductase [Deltaproteobacteria bacterium]|nr:methylenetetrahydrofolate reductase [Deltaproteobacteria bacterium]